MIDRRHLLKLLGAGGAAAAAGCAPTGGPERLVPYLVPVEDLTPGVSAEFATLCRECPAGCGMIARVRDGRVHKLEGNPQHPINRGTLCLRGHTALQDLYHPDRFRQPMARDAAGRLQPISWEEAERRLDAALLAAQGRPVAWLGRLENGPFDRLVTEWLAAISPEAVRLHYEPFAYEPLREANARVFGRPAIPDLRIAEAGTLLSFGAEFLETWISNVEYARAFSLWRQRRLRGEHRGRYLFLGPRLSLTGANADEWIPLAPGAEEHVARALALLVAAERGALAPSAEPPEATGDVSALAAAAGVRVETLARVARELLDAPPSLALPVGTAPSEAATRANVAVAQLNRLLGNVGRTWRLDRPHALEGAARHGGVLRLLERLRAGEFALLFLHEANPVYHLPPALDPGGALARVPHVVSFAGLPDETTLLAADLVLPAHRALEAWGAYAPRPDVVGLQQPVVPPVFDTREPADVLLAAAARLRRRAGGARSAGAAEPEAADFRTYLRRALGLQSEEAWFAALQHGGLFSEAAQAEAPDAGLRERAVVPPLAPPPSFAMAEAAATARPALPAAAPEARPPEASTGLRLHLFPSLHFYDGRTAARPWAQEIPDPMAKAVWGSWVELHPETAAALGAGPGDLLALATPAGKIEVPLVVTDRVHPQAVALQLGQGHAALGRYAAGVGVNPLALLDGALDPSSGALLLSGLPVSVSRLPVRRPVVVLQTSARQVGEPVARQVPLEALPALREPAGSEGPTLRRYRPEGRHHWGMVIDLDRCIGCNACVAACYAENNVPVVGREECARGREMAWLRIENYGAPEGSPGGAPAAAAPAEARPVELRFLPMLCQQCNNAPCEYVCPVYATVHSAEGLNQQVYNRCVGTRFCSNNCPYKVRRFNWHTYAFPEPLDRQLHPDVLRRPKGIMEKCTFCVQRIRRARIDAATAGRSGPGALRDGEVMTACQQTCPTDAILFGDLNDPGSRVRQLQDDPRGYGALEHLNTFPNVLYLARVRAGSAG